MSPEQVKGQTVDGRSDVFAAGILLWELVCGEKLFAGDSDFAILEKVRNGLVPAPRSVRRTCPEALEKFILKALSTDPRERYQTASDLHDDLMRFTRVGDMMYGSRQLAGWMREEFRAEWEKEQARLRTWLGVQDENGEVTPVDPAYAVSEQSSEPTQHWRIAADKDTLVVPGDIARELPTPKMDGQPALPPAQVRKGGKKRSQRRMLFFVGVPLLLTVAGGLRFMLAPEVEVRRPGKVIVTPTPSVAAQKSMEADAVALTQREPPAHELHASNKRSASPRKAEPVAQEDVNGLRMAGPSLTEARAAPSAGLGYLTAASKPAARLTIDGRDTGRWTPVPPANPIALPAGAHTVVFETADGKRVEEQLQIEAGKTSRLIRSLP
jgi:hypothetical protein